MANPLTRSLASLFRSRADTTSLKRLEREGIRTVNVLDFDQLETIIGEAIERALIESGHNGASPHRVAQDAQLEFLKLLGDEGRLDQKRDELSRQSDALVRSLGALEAELSQSQSQLAKHQAERDRNTMSELRTLLDRSLGEAFERAGADVSAISPEASAALASMQEPLRAAMLHLLAAALRRGTPGAGPSEAETEVELLNRRVKKLTAQLEETQQLLERVREEKDTADVGVPSIYKEVQGLRGSEDRIEQRRQLMREIFEHNLELRRSLAASMQIAPTAPPAPPNPNEEGPRP